MMKQHMETSSKEKLYVSKYVSLGTRETQTDLISTKSLDRTEWTSYLRYLLFFFGLVSYMDNRQPTYPYVVRIMFQRPTARASSNGAFPDTCLSIIELPGACLHNVRGAQGKVITSPFGATATDDKRPAV